MWKICFSSIDLDLCTSQNIREKKNFLRAYFDFSELFYAKQSVICNLMSWLAREKVSCLDLLEKVAYLATCGYLACCNIFIQKCSNLKVKMRQKSMFIILSKEQCLFLPRCCFAKCKTDPVCKVKMIRQKSVPS